MSCDTTGDTYQADALEKVYGPDRPETYTVAEGLERMRLLVAVQNHGHGKPDPDNPLPAVVLNENGRVDDYEETIHKEADAILTRVLAGLGHTEFKELFETLDKWYS